MKLITPRRLAALLLAASFAIPAAVMAEDRDHKRYYDKTHKDYHEWNENENRGFNIFLNENHLRVHTWQKAKPSEQQRYWQWRHDHPDERR